jgi:cytochrome c-type biogenesis protein
MWETLQTQLYYLAQGANTWVAGQLNHLGWQSLAIIFSAGLVTSLTPCMLSMLPITIGYMGGYQDGKRSAAIAESLWFALGLATTLAGLGIVAAGLGHVYGQIGTGLPIVVSAIAILMGLNLLELVPLHFPSLGATDWIKDDFPRELRAYLLGLTFGLIASPCSTPVLATLLAWVASTQNLVVGAGLLLAYTVGYVMPIAIAGSFTASLKKLLELRRWSGWINPVSGVLLIGVGMFSLLTRLPLGQF